MSEETEEIDPRLPKNLKDYPDGSLLLITFHNFLTYTDCSIVPTPYLNMILGHNGSGKSSIICGICLACGGSPKSLGRSEKIVEYIRHGCDSGYVEILIADAEKGPQKMRVSLQVGKAPKYFINDNPQTQSDVEKLRKHYNIQIDNPCAFLAQDKVKSFSEQSYIELLRNTEKAASDDLFLQHESLIKQREDSTTIEDKCATSERAKKRLEEEIEKLQPLVENYQKKVQLQSKLRLLEKKEKILKYQEADKELEEQQKKVEEATKEFREACEKIKKCEEIAKKQVDRNNHVTDNIRELRRAGNDIIKNVAIDKYRLQNVIEKARQKLTTIKNSHERHKRDLTTCENAIEVAREKLADAEVDLNGYDAFHKSYRDSEAKNAVVEQEIRKDEDEVNKLMYQRRTLENKIRSQEADTSRVYQERYQALQNFNQDAARAYRYYEQNRKNFKGDIYVPLMDMTLINNDAAKALENSVGMRDRCMFVCKFKEDERLISGSQHSWRISTAIVTQEQIHRSEIELKLPESLARLGFKYFVSECFQAPAALKQYLCNVSGLSKIPWGGEQVERNWDAVVEQLAESRYTTFLTNGLRCQVSRSRYSGEVISSSSSMREPHTFRDQSFRKSPYTRRADNDEIQGQLDELKVTLADRGEELQKKKFGIQKVRDQMRDEMMQWKSKQMVQRKWESELKMEESRMRDLKREDIDVESAEKEFEDVKKAAEQEEMEIISQKPKFQKAYLVNLRKIGQQVLLQKDARKRLAAVRVECETYETTKKDLEYDARQAELSMKDSVMGLRAASKELQKSCQLEHLTVEKMEAGEKRIFEKLNKKFAEHKIPEQLIQVEHEINSEQTRLKLAEQSGDDGSIEHEQLQKKRKEELAEEESRYQKLIDNRQRLHHDLGEEIEKWKGELEGMIERINENYVKYFDELGCRGEVSLEIPENPLDVAKYGIMIMVCFRLGEKMKRLDNKVQSGGERSVATMLYLLALQQLCPVPFRCIDEINQGMDPTNERKVFEIMVGLWNGDEGALKKTQYFLLSPKLLHDLDMRAHVNVIMVNSTLCESHAKFYDTDKYLKASIALLEA